MFTFENMERTTVTFFDSKGGGGIRRKVGYQSFKIILPTKSRFGVCGCTCRCGELIGPLWFGPNDVRSAVLGCHWDFLFLFFSFHENRNEKYARVHTKNTNFLIAV